MAILILFPGSHSLIRPGYATWPGSNWQILDVTKAISYRLHLFSLTALGTFPGEYYSTSVHLNLCRVRICESCIGTTVYCFGLDAGGHACPQPFSFVGDGAGVYKNLPVQKIDDWAQHSSTARRSSLKTPKLLLDIINDHVIWMLCYLISAIRFVLQTADAKTETIHFHLICAWIATARTAPTWKYFVIRQFPI